MGNLVTRQISALFNGVSQQPATLRAGSQHEAQVNCYSSVVDGVRKRPPFEHVARIATGNLSDAHIHAINRDTSERYIVIVTNGDLRVFDINGVEQTVHFPLGKSYLSLPSGASATTSFAVVSIADYSFVVNRTRTVATKVPPTTTPPNLGHWHSPQSWYSYDPAVPDSVYPYYNPNSFYFYRGVKQTLQELPKPTDNPPPVEGDVWKIIGLEDKSFGSYWVIRRGGVWVETQKPDEPLTLDELTMPHALVRNGDGTFTFTAFAWKVRQVGDNITNPPPTFVGSTIKDVFYYKNRLGFVSDENVVFSCAGDFGNFWRTTVTDILDSDVVDVAVSSTKVSLLEFAVPFNNGLMLFADQTQFRLNVDELLTPRTASIDTATEFEMSTICRPVGIGTDVYFVTKSGDWSRVREYYVDQDNLATDAADVTAHVPRYIPANVTRLAGNTNEDVLFAISKNEPRRIYVYKFFWSGEEKLQSAWCHWELPASDTVLSIDTIESKLYALIQRSDGVYLEVADVQSGAVTGDLDRQVLLDRLTPVTGVYLPTPGVTRFNLPYPVAGSNRSGYRIVRGSGYGSQAQSLIDPSQYSWVSSTIVEVPGNHAGLCWCGQSYTARLTFSEQFVMRDERTPITTGRLMLRTFTVYFTETAFFRTEVAPYGGAPDVESVVPAQLSEFTGKTIGDSALILGKPAYATGKYSFQIYGDSRAAKISLVNDTHVQSVFQSVEWEGLYWNRARPL